VPLLERKGNEKYFLNIDLQQTHEEQYRIPSQQLIHPSMSSIALVFKSPHSPVSSETKVTSTASVCGNEVSKSRCW
jgi:hypothetical protein